MRVNRIIGRLLVAVGLLALLIAPAAFAQKGKPSPTPTGIPLNVELAPGYSITGDGQIYSDAYQNVRAEIYYNQFYLDTNENKGDGGRRVNISFAGAGTCIPANGVPCPQGGVLDVYIATQVGADPAQLKQDESTQKRLAINWAEGAYSYHLRHNGDITLNGTDPDPRHGSVTFTCTAANANGCYQWSATPTTSEMTGATVGLYGNPIKGSVSETYLGSLTMPFVMALTKK
jgi:hypothetical protein